MSATTPSLLPLSHSNLDTLSVRHRLHCYLWHKAPGPELLPVAARAGRRVKTRTELIKREKRVNLNGGGKIRFAKKLATNESIEVNERSKG